MTAKPIEKTAVIVPVRMLSRIVDLMMDELETMHEEMQDLEARYDDLQFEFGTKSSIATYYKQEYETLKKLMDMDVEKSTKEGTNNVF